MKKILVILTVIFVGSVLLAGCNGGRRAAPFKEALKCRI